MTDLLSLSSQREVCVCRLTVYDKFIKNTHFQASNVGMCAMNFFYTQEWLRGGDRCL